MKRPLHYFKSLIVLALLSFGVSEVTAQVAPLTVVNTTGCTIFVTGIAVNPCINKCSTPIIAIAPGGFANIPGCAGVTHIWYSAGVSTALPAMFFSDNPATVGLCGPIGGGVPQFCGFTPVVGTWFGNTVVF